jgi:DNA (cytosine-5)-methyltransferase 1
MHNDGESPESFRARQAELRDKGMNGNGAGTPLPIQAKEAALWSTPTEADSRNGRNSTSRRSNPDSEHHSGDTLVDLVVKQAGLWPTPAERDHRHPNTTESQQRRNEGSKRGQQLPNFVAHTHGGGQSKSSDQTASSGALTPDFVCWLMGYPKGWLG